MELEQQSITVGTAIPAATTIDTLFNTLFANRANTQGTIGYLWSTPITVMGVYGDGSCVTARFEARPFTPTVITLGALPAPTLASVSPNTVVHGAGNTVITLTGTNFVSGAVAVASGTNLGTTFVSSTSLTATILAGQLAAAGTLSITVTNPDGQATGAVTFTMT